MKSRSLRSKLSAIYVASVLLFVAASFALVGWYDQQQAYQTASSSMEVGIGYVQGTDPSTITDKPNTRQITLEQVLSGFSRWSSISSRSGPTETRLLDWLDITNNDTDATFRIYAQDFPITVTYPPSARRTIFSQPISNRNDIVIIATLDTQTWIGTLQAQYFYSNSFILIPFILGFSVLFAELVSRMVASPITAVANAAKRLSSSDLSERVNIKSNDEIGSLAASFNSMADRLEASFAKQKQFVSDAAHELRTPLASLKTSVTKAMSSRRSEDEYQQLLGFILNRVNTLEDLVNDLLFLARVDEGRLANDEAVFNLSPIISETANSFKDLFEEKGIVFTFTVDPELKVKGTPKLHMRVLSNLLDNAFKYTPSGGSVDLLAAKKGSGVQITVRDTGRGMSTEQQTHVFDRFYKSDEVASSEKGFGLGLSITKSIVTAFGGEIKVGSELGKGTVFTITYGKDLEDKSNAVNPRDN